MIKYPTSKKQFKATKMSTKNRGLSFEADINKTNRYYLDHDKAVIYKKPTPIKPISIKFEEGKGKVISKAVFETPSTTDYNGIYRGKYIDFEAKETNSNTSFSINNIHLHQIEHLSSVQKHGGIAFILIRFAKQNKVFLYGIEKYIDFISKNERKSIPIDEFTKNGHIIQEGYTPRYDYLSIVDEVYFKEEHHGNKKSED
jgi:recombination protein U